MCCENVCAPASVGAQFDFRALGDFSSLIGSGPIHLACQSPAREMQLFSMAERREGEVVIIWVEWFHTLFPLSFLLSLSLSEEQL